MSSRDIAPPRLPQPNGAITLDYMYDLVTTLDFFIQQRANPGEGRNTKIVFTALPTSDVGLEVGTLYRIGCLLYTSPSPRDGLLSRMPSSA